ncbi:hypothetical protein ACFL39_00045 [Gemmatimonadota bacterium]
MLGGIVIGVIAELIEPGSGAWIITTIAGIFAGTKAAWNINNNRGPAIFTRAYSLSFQNDTYMREFKKANSI